MPVRAVCKLNGRSPAGGSPPPACDYSENFRQDLQDLNVGLSHPVNPVHPVHYVCTPCRFRAHRTSISAPSAVFELSITTNHNPAILTMKLSPRASCHSLSCPCAVSSLICARSKRKTPDARRVWNAPAARDSMNQSPRKFKSA